VPLVSVVIPCRNYGNLLREALASLCGGTTCLGKTPGQTVEDFEAIVVDDASEDDTPSAVSEWAELDSRVRWSRLNINGGTAAALNHGISRASGEYVYILSADDLVEPWALEVLLASCRANPRRICYGDLVIVTGGRRVKTWHLTSYDFKKVVHKNPIPCGGVMYPRRCWEEVGGYPEAMRWGREGWAFNVACGLAGWCGLHVGRESGYLYRWDGQNRSTRTSGNRPLAPTPDGTKTWREFYAKQMRALFPQVYETGEYTTMCSHCGGSRKPLGKSKTGAAAAAASVPTAPPELPGKGGFAVVEYIGPNALDQTWTVGNTSYKAGGVTRRIYVDAAHLPQILKMRGKDRKPAFVEYKPPVVAKAPAPQLTQQTPVDATPSALALAETRGIDLSGVIGTGKDGRITKQDVEAVL